MLRDLDFNKYTHVWILPNYTDMRQGIDKLAAIIQYQLNLDAYDEHSLFLFCGKRRTRLKALAFEGSGFTLVYHRINENGGEILLANVGGGCPSHDAGSIQAPYERVHDGSGGFYPETQGSRLTNAAHGITQPCVFYSKIIAKT